MSLNHMFGNLRTLSNCLLQHVMCHLAILHTLAPFSMGDRGGTPPTHTWRVIGGTENGLLVREQVGR